jgi:IS30 family transposase
MTINYTQLSLGQRYQIEALRKTGMSQKSIAQSIGVHPFTVCRELRRNVPSRGRNAETYKASQAQFLDAKAPSREGEDYALHGWHEATGLPMAGA